MRYAFEICVMGVLQSHHHRGIGRRLIKWAEMQAKAQGASYLTVKTLDGSVDHQGYTATRLFYQSVGFVELEVFPLHWDAQNPCLLMIKTI